MLKENLSTCTNNGTFLDYGRPGHVSILACLVLLIVLTIAFNLSVLVTINRDKRHKKNTRCLLSSMACVDTCVGIVIMPVEIAILFYDVAACFGLRFCDVLNSLDVTLSSMSIFHLTLLTWERHVAICKPFDYAFICSKKRLTIAYTAGWVTVLACSFGTIMPGYQLIGVEARTIECLKLQPKCDVIVGIYFVLSVSMITLVFPIVLIVFFNLKVLNCIRKTRREQNALREPGKSFSKIRHARVTVTLAVLNGCFLCCWMPFTVVNVIDTIRGQIVPVIVTTTSLWLGYANSAMNPFLFLLLEGKNFYSEKIVLFCFLLRLLMCVLVNTHIE